MNEQDLEGYCQSCCNNPNAPWQCSYSSYDCAIDCTSNVPIDGGHIFLMFALAAFGVYTLIKKYNK